MSCLDKLIASLPTQQKSADFALCSLGIKRTLNLVTEFMVNNKINNRLERSWWPRLTLEHINVNLEGSFLKKWSAQSLKEMILDKILILFLILLFKFFSLWFSSFFLFFFSTKQFLIVILGIFLLLTNLFVFFNCWRILFSKLLKAN